MAVLLDDFTPLFDKLLKRSLVRTIADKLIVLRDLEIVARYFDLRQNLSAVQRKWTALREHMFCLERKPPSGTAHCAVRGRAGL